MSFFDLTFKFHLLSFLGNHSFDFVPKFWGLFGFYETGTYGNYDTAFYCIPWGVYDCSTIASYPNTTIYNSNTVTWYTRTGISSPNAQKQANKNGVVYYYFAGA